MNYATEPEKMDEVIRQNGGALAFTLVQLIADRRQSVGVTVFVDSKAVFFMVGT